jgi:hypothetical protein
LKHFENICHHFPEVGHSDDGQSEAMLAVESVFVIPVDYPTIENSEVDHTFDEIHILVQFDHMDGLIGQEQADSEIDRSCLDQQETCIEEELDPTNLQTEQEFEVERAAELTNQMKNKKAVPFWLANQMKKDEKQEPAVVEQPEPTNLKIEEASADYAVVEK